MRKQRHKALFPGSGVSDYGKRAFFVLLFLALLTSLPPVNALFVWLDAKVVDLFFALKPEFSTEIKHPAVVITKDQTFFERFNRDPDRSDAAALLRLLKSAEVKIAALDFIYDQPTSEDHDQKFAEALQSFAYPVLAQHFLTRGKQTFETINAVDENALRPPWPLPLHNPVNQTAALKGLINLAPDFDTTIRYLPLAFHPVEKEEFLPSLGFAAYLAWLFDRSETQLAKAIAGIADRNDKCRFFQKLIDRAPFDFQTTGHNGLDSMIKKTELQLMARRLQKTFPDSIESFNLLIEKNYFSVDSEKSWLQLPSKKLPLLGNYEMPCVRLNFFKAPAPLKSDGFTQMSLGTLLQTELDLQNADKISRPDLLVTENEETTTDLNFNWAEPGKASISGKIKAVGDMPGAFVRVEMTQSGFWAETCPDKNGNFSFNNLPEGTFNLAVVFRYGENWIKSTISGTSVEGKNIELPTLHFFFPFQEVEITEKTDQNSLICFFGEPLALVTTDPQGFLPQLDFFPAFNLNLLDDDCEIEETDAKQPRDNSGNPLPNRLFALTAADDSWKNSFLFKFPAHKSKIHLPTSLDCRIAVLNPDAKDAPQQTLDLTVKPGQRNQILELPESTKLTTKPGRLILRYSDDIDEIMLLSDQEKIFTASNPTTLTLNPGNYRIFAKNGKRRGRFNRLKSLFNSRPVFFGTSLQEDQDLISTPINFLDPSFPVLPGVHLHANLFSGLLRQDFLRAAFFHPDRTPDYWHLLQGLLFLPALIGCNFLFSSNALWGGIAIASLGLAWTLAAFFAFLQGILLPVFYPLLNFAGFGILRGYYAWEIARRKENETRSTFGRFISSAVVEEILKTPDRLKPGGEKKELTIMFTDLAGFTTISEKLEPEQLTELMNEYLGEMTNLLFEHQGTLDKYIGDAIMAFWNHPHPLPNHAELAARCAIAMQKKLAVLREKWLRQGLPEVQVRAGINTSNCMVGFIGSDVQMNFTCLGDGVNLASRLEGANKNYGTLSMIAESVLNQLDSEVFSTRFLDYLVVKGKDQPIKVYELRGLRTDESKAWIEAEPSYNRGIENYLKRSWNDAIADFEAVIKLVGNDEPSTMFIDRCRKLAINPPPADWDGRFILKTK